MHELKNLAPGDVQKNIRIISPGDGEKVGAAGASCTFKLRSSETNDQMGVYEIALQPETIGAPLHYHQFLDETFIVIKGVLTLEMRDRQVEAGEGSIIHIPRFVPHGFSNHSPGEVRLILIFQPGEQREQYFYELFDLRGKETDPGQFRQLNDRYDTIQL